LRCRTNLWTEANGYYTKPPHNVNSHINLLFDGW
jgi:hypothetical protein